MSAPGDGGGSAAGQLGPSGGAASVLGTAGQTVEQATFRADSQTEGVLAGDASSDTYYGVDAEGNPVS